MSSRHERWTAISPQAGFDTINQNTIMMAGKLSLGSCLFNAITPFEMVETKMLEPAEGAKGDVWFVYDGDCPLCTTAARALRIRKAVGTLHLVNAREDRNHPVMREILERRLDLDEGMVIKFLDTCYFGADALHVMALLGTGQGWFNRWNAWMFRSKTMSRLLYPPMRTARNLLLWFLGVSKIRNLDNT